MARSELDFEQKPKRVWGQFLAMVLMLLGVFFGAAGFSFVKTAQYPLMSAIFIVGLGLISCEEIVKVHKSVVTCTLAVSLWSIRSASVHEEDLMDELRLELGNVGSVVFFLIPSMAIVETIDLHDGFAILRAAVTRITRRDPRWMLPLVSCITFFLSAILDNLTSTIVMVQLLRGLLPQGEFRKFSGSVVVLAANAGGAWSPVGDVTTTMLWITDRITVSSIIFHLFLPSLISLLFPLTIIFVRSIWFGDVGRHDLATFAQSRAKPRTIGKAEPAEEDTPHGPSAVTIGSTAASSRDSAIDRAIRTQTATFGDDVDEHELEMAEQGIQKHITEEGDDDDVRVQETTREDVTLAGDEVVMRSDPHDIPREGTVMFFVGMFFLCSIPVVKILTHLPPYMPCLLALACFWLFVDLWHKKKSGLYESRKGMTVALRQIDMPGVMFFVGILLSVGALNSAGLLHDLSKWLAAVCQGSVGLLTFILGCVSSIVDNVPMVEGVIEMYIGDYPTDHMLWQLTAFCAGTGGRRKKQFKF